MLVVFDIELRHVFRSSELQMGLNGFNCIINKSTEDSVFDYRLLRYSNVCDG
jgi:hypothetical protein